MSKTMRMIALSSVSATGVSSVAIAQDQGSQHGATLKSNLSGDTGNRDEQVFIMSSERKGKVSMSGSVGFYNSSNAGLAFGFAVKPKDTLMAQGRSARQPLWMENFGDNVSVSFGW